MLSDIGIKSAVEMSREEVIELVDKNKDGWGHIRSKCLTVGDRIEMVAWTSKVVSSYLLYGGDPEKARFWMSDMIPNLVQGILWGVPQEILDKKLK